MNAILRGALLCSLVTVGAGCKPTETESAVASARPDGTGRYFKSVVNCHLHLAQNPPVKGKVVTSDELRRQAGIALNGGVSAMVHFGVVYEEATKSLTTHRVNISRGTTYVDSYETVLEDKIAVRGVIAADKVELAGDGFTFKMTSLGAPATGSLASTLRNGAKGSLKLADGREWTDLTCSFSPTSQAAPQVKASETTEPVATNEVLVPPAAKTEELY